MNRAVASLALDAIQRRIGVPVQVHLDEEPPGALEISPADVHPNDSFSVRFSPGWRAAEAHFLPGMFAAPLVEQMGHAPADARSVFVAFATVLNRRRACLTFRVNGADVSPLDTESWPTRWEKLELGARSTPQVIEPEDVAQMRQLVLELVVPVFGMVAALIGVEEPVSNTGTVPEGMPYQALVTRYERKKVNREACVQLRGLRCSACGLDFSAVYGELGAGYIEVHHTTPVSDLGPDYRVDVLKDLVPLCANCHAMVHRKSPPLLVDELAALVAERKRD